MICGEQKWFSELEKIVHWQTWLFFVITEAVLCVTPGPAVLFVLSQALRRGAGKSVWASGGILTANAAYFVLSATSLGAIILASYKLFFFIKWAGAAYLFYLGARSLLSKSPILAIPETEVAEASGSRILRDGLFLQGANPKALLFFTAILPQFVDARNPVAPQIAILGISSMVIEFIILFTYGQLAERAWSVARSTRFETWTNRIAGSLLIAAGIGLMRLRRV
jgi:homoserine/homoserine lactone efflux protein